MKAWIVRFLSLYVYNIVVLLVIGLLTPAHVGVAVIWAAVILSLAELFVRPLIQGYFTRRAAKTAGERTRAGEWLTQTLIVLVVAFIIWIITVLLTGVNTRGSVFWAFVLPPVILTIGWWVYARIDQRIEAKAGEYYDRATGGITGEKSAAGADAPAATPVADDGLTPEQRKMLDELGS